MSSTYRVLCLSHNPAIQTGVEWSSGTNNAAALDLVPERVPGHENCDLVIGQYSYPLVAVGCLHKKHHHCNGGWDEADWLRLLLLAQGQPEGSPFRDQANRGCFRMCWPPARLERLRNELFPDGEVP